MSKTQGTLEIEEALYRDARRLGVYGCFEMSVGFSRHHEEYGDQRVDFITMDSQCVFRAYEVKVSKSDFHSTCTNSFIGHFNYYAMPRNLYEQVKSEVPEHIGVWCDGEVIKKPKRVTPIVEPYVLAISMVRSLSRDADRYLTAMFDKDTPENQRLQKERRKNKETIGQLRREVKRLQEYLSMAKGSRVRDLSERADSLDFYRRLFREARDECHNLRAQIKQLLAAADATKGVEGS